MKRLFIHFAGPLAITFGFLYLLCVPAGADAKIIPLKGGNPGQGFSPLAEDAGSIKIGGGEVTVQDIMFGEEPSGISGSGGTVAADSINSASLGFGEKLTSEDANMAEL